MWGKPPVESSEAEAPAREIAPLDGFADAHRELVADQAIQFELRPFRREPPPFDLPDLAWLAPFFRIFLWVFVALVAAWLLYLIVNRLTGFSLRRRRDRDGPEGEPEWHIDEQPARALLSEADALAAAGRYSEAAHLLLFRSIEEIDQRRPASVRRALTSRDIAGLPVLPARPAEAFTSIVRAVERSLFGGRALGADDWRDCRAAYERFAFAEGWRG